MVLVLPRIILVMAPSSCFLNDASMSFVVQLDFNNIFDNLMTKSRNELLEAYTFNFIVKTKGLLDVGIKPSHNH